MKSFTFTLISLFSTWVMAAPLVGLNPTFDALPMDVSEELKACPAPYLPAYCKDHMKKKPECELESLSILEELVGKTYVQVNTKESCEKRLDERKS